MENASSSTSGDDSRGGDVLKLIETLRDPALAEQLFRRWLGVGSFLIIAMFVAYWIGEQRTAALSLCVAVAIVVFITVGMQHRAWLLILFAWGMTGTCSYLPFGLSFRDVSILLAFSAYATHRIVTHADVRRPFHILDAILAANIIWLAVTFIHHPVGFRVFGATTIGGRPFINIALALLAFWVVVRLPNSARSVSHVPLYILAGTSVIAMLNIIVTLVPSTTVYLYPFYGSVDLSGYAQMIGAGAEGGMRLTGLRPFGYMLVLVLCAFREPRVLFNPLRPWFYLLLLGFAAVLVSGFRSALLGVIVMLAVSAWLHRGWRGLVMTTVPAGLLLAAVIAGQGRLYDLPPSTQRALSFLPGQWSPIVLADAENSSESRFRWWHDVIEQDLIKDWRYGDGFGVLESDYDTLKSSTTAFDWFTITGAFHNGPLTSIRFVGVPGLILFYLFMLAAAVYSLKCVQLCRGTPLEPAAIFVALPLLWTPIEYTVIFGAFDSQLPEHILLVALLLLIMRMAPQARSTAPVQSSPPPTTSKMAVAQSFR